MDKYIFDESNGLWYELQGDYYIPCLLISKIKKYRQWQCLHCSSRPLTVLRILLSLSVAFFNFKRCLKQLIVLKYMLIQIRV